jgi:predicted amidohydrolase YtcJ
MTERSASLLLYGGVIQGRADCDSIAICGGQISALGRFEDLRRLAGQETRLTDLRGAVVAPGFSDCHLHFLEAASASAGLDLSRETSLARILERLRVHASSTPPGAWVKAFGCDEAQTVEGRGPSCAELDRVAPNNPLRLRHQTLHASWLNSRAIETLGLEACARALPAAAQVLGSADETLSGLVVGLEKRLSRRIPRMSRDELEARARAFGGTLAKAGITSFTDAGADNGPEEVELFAGLVRAGVIRQRVGLMIGAEHLDHVQSAQQTADKAAMRLCAVKFMPAAAMQHDGFRSARERELSEWVKRVERALKLGLACAFHATEVEELETALSVIERAQARLKAKGLFSDEPTAPVRFRIEHGSLIPPNYLERLAACRAWVVSNPGFLYYRGRKYAGEPGLSPHLFALRSLIDAGVPVAGGTDAPVTPAKPLTAVYAAVARRSMGGDELCAQQALSIGEALSLFTSRAAQLDGREGGVLAVGRPADLVVLSANPLDVPPGKFENLYVKMTIVGGSIVHEERGQADPIALEKAPLK